MSRARRAVIVALAAVVSAATTSACGSSGSSGGGTGSSSGTTASTSVIANSAPITVTAGVEMIPVSRLVDGVAALCRAAVQARAAGSGSDAVPSAGAAAGATFFDGAHEVMHELARAVEQSDRASAARLLEAKEAVEADLSHHAAPPALAADLSHLFDAAVVGLGRLAIPAPPCQK